jgi:hypothetical protein
MIFFAQRRKDAKSRSPLSRHSREGGNPVGFERAIRRYRVLAFAGMAKFEEGVLRAFAPLRENQDPEFAA